MCYRFTCCHISLSKPAGGFSLYATICAADGDISGIKRFTHNCDWSCGATDGLDRYFASSVADIVDVVPSIGRVKYNFKTLEY